MIRTNRNAFKGSVSPAAHPTWFRITYGAAVIVLGYSVIRQWAMYITTAPAFIVTLSEGVNRPLPEYLIGIHAFMFGYSWLILPIFLAALLVVMLFFFGKCPIVVIHWFFITLIALEVGSTWCFLAALKFVVQAYLQVDPG